MARLTLVRAGTRGAVRLACAGAVLALLVPVAWAAAKTPLEREVKAAYLYKFPGYVDWPASAFPRADMPFTIGVHGDAEMATRLRRLVAGRTIAGRPVVVREIEDPGPADTLQLFFVSRTDDPRTEQIVGHLPSRPCLVVTEAERLPSGSVINFVLVGGRVRFDISRVAAERAQLGLSSRLLAVARRVVRP